MARTNPYITAAVRLACRTQQRDMVGGGGKKTDRTAVERQLPLCNPSDWHLPASCQRIHLLYHGRIFLCG